MYQKTVALRSRACPEEGVVSKVRRENVSIFHPVLDIFSGCFADYFAACCGYDADGRAGDEGLEEYIQAVEEMGTTTNQVNGVR